MIPRVKSRYRIITSVFLTAFAFYAAVYGVSYAYVLHHLANILCTWFVAIHFDVSSLSVENISTILETMDPDKKQP